MADQFLGEIRMFAAPFAPQGWLLCDGSTIAISTAPALFEVIGTTYGGDGVNNFTLPQMGGRTAVHRSASLPCGSAGGSELVKLTAAQLAPHSHEFVVSSVAGTSADPTGGMIATPTPFNLYLEDSPSTPLNVNAISTNGGGLEHPNMQPWLCVNFIIATEGAPLA